MQHAARVEKDRMRRCHMRVHASHVGRRIAARCIAESWKQTTLCYMSAASVRPQWARGNATALGIRSVAVKAERVRAHELHKLVVGEAAVASAAVAGARETAGDPYLPVTYPKP